MTKTIANNIASYLETLDIFEDFAATLVAASSNSSAINLFIGIEPPRPKDCVSIITYGGKAPLVDGYRQESFVQVRVRSDTRSRAISTCQFFINNLHGLKLENVGRLNCINSAPLILQPITIEGREGGELSVTVSNYEIKHVKV